MKKPLRYFSIVVFAVSLWVVEGIGFADDQSRWLAKEMDEAYTIKPGMTVEQLREVFGREGGGGFVRVEKTHELAYTFCLKTCSFIKIDVQFEGPAQGYDIKAGSKIRWVSKPYLERQILD